MATFVPTEQYPCLNSTYRLISRQDASSAELHAILDQQHQHVSELSLSVFCYNIPTYMYPYDIPIRVYAKLWKYLYKRGGPLIYIFKTTLV